jgi:hypothetical protein
MHCTMRCIRSQLLENWGQSHITSTKPCHLAYLARIRLELDTRLVDGKPVRLSPGMAASVEIKTGTRRIIEYILTPLLKMTNEVGRER